MLTGISAVLQSSPLCGSIAAAGDILRKINGNIIGDILDYQYYSYDSRILLELTGSDGGIKLVRVNKPEGADLGLEFESALMDKERSCCNKCIFCFIDQLPKGMRETLYYKDDDVRLSILQGNYVTLTNLTQGDIERIIKLRISPINVSVHTLDPKLRQFMLGHDGRMPDITKILKTLTRAGIILNCQIVCCPGINDGKELDKTMNGFQKLGEAVNSVSVVPVGLTKHREGLHKLQPFDAKLAKKTIRQVEKFRGKCGKTQEKKVFYCADELFMLAGEKLPPDKYYDDYPQLENGVGMMRLFIKDFKEALKALETPATQNSDIVSIATGTLAAPYLKNLIEKARLRSSKFPECRIYPVNNGFFGTSVTVSGLVTGGDILRQLQGKDLGSRLLIPRNMLRSGEDVFLDDMTVRELSEALRVTVMPVDVNGRALCENLLSL